MKKLNIICLLIIVSGSIWSVNKNDIPLYKNVEIPVEDRVNDLLSKMTLEEKLIYIGGYNKFYIMAIPRMGIPVIKITDGPMGTRNDGASTAYPASILSASTWDTTLINKLGHALGIDARSRGAHILLGPGVNIYRAPMCGRNFEYFGEDPYLSARMAVEYIKGVQAEGVVATVKHFAANNQEWDRNNVSSDVDERTLAEIYLPAFKASVVEAGVGSVMCSYNLINGIWASENYHLLTEILKKDWKFDGFVMSDWGATHDGGKAALAGLDLEMPAGDYMNNTNLSPLISNGTISQSVIDDKVRRILRVLFRFGFFDRDQLDSSIPRDYAPNDQLALDLASKGIVLLKNQDSILPLDRNTVKSIAVIGQNANNYIAGSGSSYITPNHPVTILAGIKAIAGNDITVTYDPAIDDETGIYENSIFYTDNSLSVKGLTASYYANKTLSEPVVATRVDTTINFDWGKSSPGISGIGSDAFSVRWVGVLKVAESGDYTFFDRSDDGSRLWINNNRIINQWSNHSAATKQATVHLNKDVIYNIKLEYYESTGNAEVKMGCKIVEFNNSPAVLAAKNADVAIVCAGFDASTEGEGFDRPFQMPNNQGSLINAIVSVNPNTIVILNAGGNVATTNWINNVKGVIHGWYGGQEGGTAMAGILFGLTNPSGKLPVTFEKKWEDNPTYNNYYDPDGDKRVPYSEGLLVGYRYYDTKNVEPLFPFGFGLSYTTFDYSNLVITPTQTDKPNSVEVSFDVTNSGGMAGAEVAQLYISEQSPKVYRPNKELKGFVRVFLNPGETKNLTIKLDSASFSYFKLKKKAFGYDPGNFDILVGASSKDIRLRGSVTIDKQDETNPVIISLTPENNSNLLPGINTFSIKFSEPVYYNYNKEIFLKNYATDEVVEIIDMSTVTGKGTNTVCFKTNTELKDNVRYYIETGDSTFLDYSDNSCAGILGKDSWNFMISATGTEYHRDINKFIAYPNPANDKITMTNFPGHHNALTVELLNLTGRKIDAFVLPANQNWFEYNSSILSPGIYFVKIPSDSGILIKKIIKK